MARLKTSLLKIASILAALLCISLLPVRLLRRQITHQTFSLWVGTPILNMAINAQSERLLGVKARSLVYSTYFITNKFDYDLSSWVQIPVLGKLIPFFVFIWIGICVDRLHAYCDQGALLPLRRLTFNRWELWAYKAIGLPIFVWTYGADVRSRETTQQLGEPNCCSECDAVKIACICDEAQRVDNLAMLRRWSTAIFSMGDMIEYTPGSRNDLFFWPVNIDGDQGSRYTPIYPVSQSQKPVKIVHAPNHRKFKGTHFFLAAIEQLQNEGFAIDLQLVEKVPNEEALKIYQSADLIFDQCLIGYHGYFALEGLAMGKPVMCFIRKPQTYLLAPEECPIINTHVSTLEADIRNLLTHRECLQEIGIRGRQYIEKHYTLDAFSRRLKSAYDDLGIPV